MLLYGCKDMEILRFASLRQSSSLLTNIAGIECNPTVVAVSVGPGDLDAARRLLTAAPQKSELCFVVIQRHDVQHDDDVGDVAARLACNLAMPVVEVENGATLCANHVYVSPPDALVSVRDSAFFIRPQASGAGSPSPFDYFLVALAKEYGARAIAICLAGAGDERQSGLRSIHEQGGLVIAQDPCQTARDNPVRQANIASVVDLVLPIERIPDVLLWLSAGRREPGAASDGAQALAGIVRHLSGPLGRNIESYKDSTLLRRVFRRMTRVGARDLTDYLSTLQGEADETRELTKDMLVHVTSFFRDPKSYESLARTVIPKLVRQHPRSDPIRIWVAGCSTGEEAYSVAMLFLEEIARAKRDLRLQILATDISERAIALGRAGLYAGLYPESIHRYVATPRLRRFFI